MCRWRARISRVDSHCVRHVRARPSAPDRAVGSPGLRSSVALAIIARLIRLFAPRRMSASLTNSRRRSERSADPASNHTPLQPTQPNERTSAPEGSARKCAYIADEERSIGHLADRNQALALKLSCDRPHGEFMESDLSWVKATDPVIDDQ